MRVTRERLPGGWAAIFVNAEQTIVVEIRLDDDQAAEAQRLMGTRCVGAFAIVMRKELVAEAV